MPDQEHLAFGVIGRPRGLKGQVYLNVYNVDSKRIQPGLVLSLDKFSEGARYLTIRALGGTAGKGRYIVHFEGIDSRQAAEDLGRANVYLDRAELDEVDANSFYHADVVGYTVRTESGAVLGEVRSVVVGGHDILVVSDQVNEWMLPVLSEVVTSVDHEARCFHVTLPEGLEPHNLASAPRTDEG